VLYTVGDLSALSCSPDDAHNDADTHVESPITSSSFLHLVGYFFTFMIQDARSYEIKNIQHLEHGEKFEIRNVKTSL
jgi:hypothetical protein